MIASMSRPSSWLLSMALLASMPGLAAERLAVVDISRASHAQVEGLKRLPPEAWWLEMGDQLVVVGDAASALVAASKLPLLATRDHVEADRLMLRAQGCSEHSAEQGKVVAEGGRWQLRQLASYEVEALERDPGASWRAVPRNTTLARQFRLDAPATAKAIDPAVQQVVDRVDAVRWFADVETLAGWDRHSRATTSLTFARQWIEGRFEGLGLDVSLQPMQLSGPGGPVTRYNVIGRWTGASQPDRWAIVGGHYDSINGSGTTNNTPGAEDNATGCAGVIELARVLLPSNPSSSILFMCYVGEEQGMLGSGAHVTALQQDGDIAKIDFVVIMDMIGYSADAKLQGLFETFDDHEDYLMRFGAAAAAYVPELDVVFSTMPFGSDHMPYLSAGVPAVLAIENDWDSYPHYHSSADTPANIGPFARDMGGAILKTNAAVIAELGGLTAPSFQDGFEGEP